MYDKCEGEGGSKLNGWRLHPDGELIPIVAAIQLIDALLELFTTSHPILIAIGDFDERVGTAVDGCEDLGRRERRRRVRRIGRSAPS